MTIKVDNKPGSKIGSQYYVQNKFDDTLSDVYNMDPSQLLKDQDFKSVLKEKNIDMAQTNLDEMKFPINSKFVKDQYNKIDYNTWLDQNDIYDIDEATQFKTI